MSALDYEVRVAIERAVADVVGARFNPVIRLTVAQAAEAVGMSRAALYQAVAAGELKAYRLGGKGDMGISPTELRLWALGQ